MKTNLVKFDGKTVKPIVGYEDRYVVSDDGDVWSIKRNVFCHGEIVETHKPHKLKPSIDSRGYFVVNLYNGKNRKSKKVHNIVAEAFIANPQKKKCACHVDNNKRNNSVDNLYWGTDSENLKQAWRDGLYKTEMPVAQIDASGNIVEVFKSQAEAARKLGVSQQNISSCVRGLRKAVGGYAWRESV